MNGPKGWSWWVLVPMVVVAGLCHAVSFLVALFGRRRMVGLLILTVALAGCAATLEHPLTHQRATCRSGWALGGGTGIAGGVMAGIALVGNILYVAEYQKCVDTLKRAGYEEVTPSPASNAPDDPSQAGREPG